jgi:hypothetical protein
VRERQGMGGAILGHASLGQKSGCPFGCCKLIGHLGRGGDGGELDTAEVDEALRCIRNLAGNVARPMGVVMA